MPTLMNSRPVGGKPAQFDRASQNRRTMIAKIHVAKRELALDEDDYRQILFEETRHKSLTDCTEGELVRVIDRLKRQGFKPLPGRGKTAKAQHPMAKKARALWISLYQLGVVRNSSEAALEAFAKRQLGCDRLVWARQSDAYKLIEALKQMATRAGWRQSDDNGKRLLPMQLQIGLCNQILFRLQEIDTAHRDWTLATAAWRLCGMELPAALTGTGEQAEAYARLAAALGKKLRDDLPNLETALDDAS